MLKLHEKYTKATKCSQSKHSPQVVMDFKTTLDKLFDICFCQCSRSSEMSKGKMKCNCNPENRVMSKEVEFLFDQRSIRKLFIGKSIDSSTTLKYTSNQNWELKRQREKSASSQGNASDSDQSIPSSGSSSTALEDRTRPVKYFPDPTESDSEKSVTEYDDPDFVGPKGRYYKKKKDTITSKACSDADRRCQSLRSMSEGITNTVAALGQPEQKAWTNN